MVGLSAGASAGASCHAAAGATGAQAKRWAPSLHGPMGARPWRTKARPSLPGSLPDSVVTAAQAPAPGGAPPWELPGRSAEFRARAARQHKRARGARNSGGKGPWTDRGTGMRCDAMRRSSGSRAQRMQRWTASSCSRMRVSSSSSIPPPIPHFVPFLIVVLNSLTPSD